MIYLFLILELQWILWIFFDKNEINGYFYCSWNIFKMITIKYYIIVFDEIDPYHIHILYLYIWYRKLYLYILNIWINTFFIYGN